MWGKSSLTNTPWETNADLHQLPEHMIYIPKQIQNRWWVNGNLVLSPVSQVEHLMVYWLHSLLQLSQLKLHSLQSIEISRHVRWLKLGEKKSCSAKPRNHMYVSKDCQKTTPPQQYFESNHSVSSSKTKLTQQESSLWDCFKNLYNNTFEGKGFVSELQQNQNYKKWVHEIAIKKTFVTTTHLKVNCLCQSSNKTKPG
jgi:hypothetical protein